jgi:outer membrane protein
MLKKIVLFALLLLPAGAIAQEKIAYFNPSEIIVIMPEWKQMQDSLQKMQTFMQKEMEILREEYNKKYQALMNEGEGLIESIKLRRMQEIQDLEQRASVFNEQSQQELEQTYRTLSEPIQKKIRDAVQAVGKAHNFLFVLEGNGLWYISPNAADATPLVQRQLGL